MFGSKGSKKSSESVESKANDAPTSNEAELPVVVNEPVPIILDGKAYSTRVINGRYEVIEILFDSKTLQLGDIKVLHSDDDRGTMIERFKIACVTGGVI